jgi:sulfide:quinone oxidoreductase
LSEPADRAQDQTSAVPLAVLIAGGGVAGLEAAFALRELAGDRVSVTVLAPTEQFVLRPGSVGAPFTASWAQTYPLPKLVAAAGARLEQGALAEVDPGRRVAVTTDGARLGYDALLVCPGASVTQPYEHATPFDDSRADELLHGLVQDVEEGYVKRLAIVVPAPMPWPLPAYELALLTAARAWETRAQTAITILTPERAPLEPFGPGASDGVAQLLAEREIELVTSAYCEIPRTGTVVVHPGDRTVEADRIVALPALAGPGVRGLPQDGNGFIPIDDRGRVAGADRVWAAGDATDTPIKLGGLAAQLADTIAAQIAAQAGAGPEPGPFEPLLEAVLLTGAAPLQLHARLRDGSYLESELTEIAGELPPKIAARYLAAHLDAA